VGKSIGADSEVGWVGMKEEDEFDDDEVGAVVVLGD